MKRSSFLVALALHIGAIALLLSIKREKIVTKTFERPPAVWIRQVPSDSDELKKVRGKASTGEGEQASLPKSAFEKEDTHVRRLFGLPEQPDRADFTGTTQAGVERSGTGLIARGNDSVGLMAGLGATRTGDRIKSLPDVQWLSQFYEQVDQALVYPQLFAKHGIQGSVLVSFKVIPGAPLHFEVGDVQADSPYLRVVSLRALRLGMRVATQNAGYRRESPLSLTARFHFQLLNHKRYDDEKEHQFMSGTVLAYHRELSTNPLAWKLGPLAGIIGAPSIGIDPMWFYEQSKELLKQETKGDPLDEFRRDPDFKT